MAPGKQNNPGKSKRSDYLSKNVFHPKLRYFLELLNVAITTPPEQIKKNYYKFALKYHPDKNTDSDLSQKLFSDLALAYETLIDPEKIKKLNEEYLESLPQRVNVGGCVFNIGGFFGSRYFARDASDMYSLKRNISAAIGYKSQENITPVFYDDDYYEEENSVLDSPEWDMFELMFSGGMNDETLKILQKNFFANGFDCFFELPWVYANMQGFLYFLHGNFDAAGKIYNKLNTLIKNNIIFNYRAGLCYEAQYYKKKTMKQRVDSDELEKALKLFEAAIDIASHRFITERQHCFLIRKSIADLYEAMGRRREAIKMWQYIMRNKKGYSIEAEEKIRDLSKIRIFSKPKYSVERMKINAMSDFLKKSEEPKKLISEKISDMV